MQRDELIEELGLGPVWKLRSSTGAVLKAKREETVAAVEVRSAPAPAAGDSSWTVLFDEIRACTACGRCRQRKQAVPGAGDFSADWLFVGNYPVEEDSEGGEPFFGVAGKLLGNMLASLGLARGKQVYLTNAVKCGAQTRPTQEETATCRVHLEREIDLVKPKIIVLLGRTAVSSVLADDAGLTTLRGRIQAYRGIPVVVTCHPAYLLRNPMEKAQVWEDLCLARRTLAKNGRG